MNPICLVAGNGQRIETAASPSPQFRSLSCSSRHLEGFLAARRNKAWPGREILSF